MGWGWFIYFSDACGKVLLGCDGSNVEALHVRLSAGPERALYEAEPQNPARIGM